MVAVEGCGCCAADSSAERWREGGARRGDSASPATLSAIPATYCPNDVRKLIATLTLHTLVHTTKYSHFHYTLTCYTADSILHYERRPLKQRQIN